MTEVISPTVTEIQESDTKRTGWFDLGLHSYIKIFIISFLFIWLFRNELFLMFHQWTDDSNWSHGFLIPLFSLYFINQQKKQLLNLKYAEDPLLSLFHGRWPMRLKEGETRTNYLGLLVIFFGISSYIFNTVSPSGYAYFRQVSILVVLGGIVLFLGGWHLIKYMWLPIFFLIFAIPLPGRYYVSITMPMRKLAAQIAGIILNFVNGLEATVNGVVIDVIYKGVRIEPPLNVAEACSGMRLLMAFVALGVAMAYLHYRPIWQRLILLASTIPIAILCNIVRVTITGFIYILLDPKYASGIYHDVLGLSMLPLAFALYGFLAWFMSNLFVEHTKADYENIIVRKKINSDN